jgi:hypothetical protein
MAKTFNYKKKGIIDFVHKTYYIRASEEAATHFSLKPSYLFSLSWL